MADDALGAPVAVIGASGRTGSRVVDALVARGATVRGITRRSAALPAVHETRTADLEDESSLVAALEGAGAVYIVPPPFRSNEDRMIASAAQAAVRAGAGRVVLHSVIHPHTPALPHHIRKAAGEDAVRRCGVAWTILQPAVYAQTVSHAIVGPDDEVGVPWNPEAPMAAVHLGDVAEVAATVLTDDGHDAATYELAGPECLGLSTMIAIVAQVTGRTLRTRELGPGGWALFEQGSPEADAVAAMCAEYDAYGLPGNANVLSWLLGRPATSFAEAVRADSRRPA
ncbi:SDR family oxidoreductase [Actinomycetospora chiangmaiensis]|uniref:SDR family oxidoreductase n=1 Tax=Actinomycetospora chiangmaiensis TaxID=402650 RepID=UPI00039CE469|nr:NmrA family NAD(P)-binding protein [Actinomycetospora chiangmaiensis]